MARKAVKKNEISDEALAKIREDVARYRPGLWAEEVAYGPACICGLRDTGRCPRHDDTDAPE